jgi:RNA polymerase sigma factor (TIGR02999 family)
LSLTNLDNQTDTNAFENLTASLYQQLKKMASTQRWIIGTGSETLCTTVLVHESFLRLRHVHEWQDANHFLRTASKAMRFALIDYIRSQTSGKRNSHDLESWISILDGQTTPGNWLIDLDDAIVALEKEDARLARVVECLFFAGLTEQETAQLLDINERTVRRDWQKARSWLCMTLSEQ